jgi:hypothetical protein
MKRELTPRKKYAIVAECHKYRDQISGRLQDGALKVISEKFNGVSARAIRGYCQEAKKQEDAGMLSIDLSSKKKGKVGRKSKLTDEVKDIYIDIIREYAHSWRHLPERLLSEKLKEHDIVLPISTVHSHLKQLNAHHKVIKLKPLLTQTHMDNRCLSILDQIDKNSGKGRGILQFDDHLDSVHVDESWFNLMKNENKVLVCDGVDVGIAPECQHKSHIEKIMFLAAVARPRELPDGTWFDGKIGIFP